MRRTFVFAAIVFAFISGAASVPDAALAQEVTFTASANTTTAAEGEQCQVTFTLSGGNLKSYSDFRQPNLNADFLTLMGPSTSQQMSIINGKVSASIGWTYVLQPRNKGTYTISPASISYDGKTLKTNPIKITVVTGSQKQGQTQKGNSSGGGEKVDVGAEFMLKSIPDKREVYVGEPVRVTYKLYSRLEFQLENIVKIPRSVGFWSEELEAPKQLQPQIEVLNGRQYQTFIVRKMAYFPTQSGNLNIEPFEISSIVQVRVKRQTGNSIRDRFFSDPFFDSYKNVRYTLSTDKLGITVKPLPEKGKPESFAGAVGRYSMDAAIDNYSPKANETVTLKVKIAGSGNLKLLNEPKITVPSGVDAYPPNIVDDFAAESGSLSGTKTFEYILIPRFAGQVTVPPVEFSYYDLEKKQYVTLTSKEFALNIGKGDIATEENQPHSERIRYLAMDIKPLKEGGHEFRRRGESALDVPAMLGLYAMPMVLAALGIAWKRRYDRIHGDIAGLKMRRASRTAEKHLSASRKYLDRNMIDLYYQEVARALWGYIQHKLSIPTSETSIAGVVAILEQRQVVQQTIADTQAALEGIEFARFSPTRATASEMSNLYDKAKTAIISIEQELRV